MSKRKAVYTELLHAEKAVYEAINKLVAARSKASLHQLRWAKGEENPLLFSLCGRLAEINWIWNEFHRQLADRQLKVNQVFRKIYQEEKIVEEARKDLHGCASKVAKLQKQVESARRKNDPVKVQTLELELGTQASLHTHLSTTVATQKQKLELYKLSALKKSFRVQAEEIINAASRSQALFEAQLQLLGQLPDTTTSECNNDCKDIEQQMVEVLSRISDTLDTHSPPNGGIDAKKLLASPAQSPAVSRRFFFDPLSRERRSCVEPIIQDRCSCIEPITAEVHLSPRSCQSLGEIRSGIASQSNRASQAFLYAQRPLPEAPKEETTILESGEYTEIDSETSEGLLSSETTNQVRLRKSDSTPLLHERRAQNKQKHLSTISIDQHHEAILLDESQSTASQHSGSRPDSIPLSSMEDLEADDMESGYATVLTAGTEMGNGLELDSDSDENGYADPIDAIHLFLDTQQPGSEGGEGDGNRPYQTIEEVRRLRELQMLERQRNNSSSTDSGHQSMLFDEVPGYSRPFDALSETSEPIKITPEVPLSSQKLSLSPLPWQQGVSPKSERRARSPMLARSATAGAELSTRSATADGEMSTRSVTAGGKLTTPVREKRTSLQLLHSNNEYESCLDFPPGLDRRRTFPCEEHRKHLPDTHTQEKRSSSLTSDIDLQPPTRLPPQAEERLSPTLVNSRDSSNDSDGLTSNIDMQPPASLPPQAEEQPSPTLVNSRGSLDGLILDIDLRSLASLPPQAAERLSPTLVNGGDPLISDEWPDKTVRERLDWSPTVADRERPVSDASGAQGRLNQSPAAVRKLRCGQAQLVSPEIVRKSATN